MKIRSIAVLFLCAMALSACGESQDNQTSGQNRSDFQNLCELSSGTVVELADGERCRCSGETCDAGLVCNVSTKKCPSTVSSQCTSGEQRCSSGTLYECVDNNLILKETCSLNLGCTLDNSKCAECAADDKKCDGAKLMKCGANGEFVDDIECPAGCDESKNACAETCTENDTLCTDGNLQTCKGGVYGQSTPCENKTSCKADGKSCGECTNGDTKCDEQGSYTCENGSWSAPTACKGGASCKADGKSCGECTNGDTKCDEQGSYTCENGSWSAPTACEGGTSCKADGKSCGECTNGVKKCENDEQGFGQIQTCTGGAWVETTPCGEDENRLSCDAETNECGECLNGSDICENSDDKRGALFTCENGKKNKVNSCILHMEDRGVTREMEVSCNAKGTACGECISGIDICIATQLSSAMYICTDGEPSKWLETCVKGCHATFFQCR